jgi:tetratricopeptide (TPR) repeat protein
MSAKLFPWILVAALPALASLPARATVPADLAPGVQLVEARRFEEARKFFEPRAIQDPRSAEAAYYLGRSLFGLGRYEPAAEWLEKASALTPRDGDVLLWLGRSYGHAAMHANILRQAGLAKKCRLAWEKGVAVDPDNLDVRGDLIQYYLRAPGFMGGSENKAREQAAEIRKRDAVRGTLAAVTLQLHKKDEAGAIRTLQDAIRAKPDPRLHLRLGMIYEGKGDKARARTQYESALKLDPNLKEAKEALAKLG